MCRNYLDAQSLGHLLEEAGKFLPVKDSALVNTQFHSLDEAGFFALL